MSSTITSGTYISATGVITLTLSAPASFAAGNFILLSSLTGTGEFNFLNGTWTAIAPTSGAALTLQGPVGLPTTTITGGTADFAPVVYFEQRGEEPRLPRTGRRGGAAVFAGDQGNEGIYFGGPPDATTKWPYSPQEWQPPALRSAQRMGGVLPGDASGLDSIATKLFVPQAEGWGVQPVQPPARFMGTRAMMAGAFARGDDGIIATFSPPWTVAARATTFPNEQNDPKAAIPVYQAGPQIGAFKTLPNITSPQVLKNSPGSVIGISVITAGSTAGGLYDTPAPNGAVAANQIWVIPMTVGYYELEWPCQQGIVIVPGTGQVLAAKWT
jgi:hypothetical protein